MYSLRRLRSFNICGKRLGRLYHPVLFLMLSLSYLCVTDQHFLSAVSVLKHFINEVDDDDNDDDDAL